MQRNSNLKMPSGVLGLSIILVFSLVGITACAVSPDKPQATESTVAGTPTQTAPSTASEAKSELETSEPPATATPNDGVQQQSPSSDAQVMEPKMDAQTELKLEPIPVTAPEADSTAMGTVTESQQPLEIAKIEPAVGKPMVPATAVAGANRFVITVDEKDSRHPQFGKGNPMGFLINGVPGGAVVVERGKTYQFDVKTNPKHDVYISTKPIGWGASPWSEGVEGAYIYQGTMQFTPSDSAPDVLYYSCRNHPNMGGEIRVINPGEKIDLATLANAGATNAGSTPGNTTAKSAKPQISVAMVNQKLMYADMLVKSTASDRISSSANVQAKQMQLDAEKMIGQAKDRLKAGDNEEAYRMAEDALTSLKTAASLVPSEEEIAVLKESHQELLTSIHNFEQSHKESYERMRKAGGKTIAVDYDRNQVAQLKNDAKSLADKNDYVNANKKLETARHIITTAIQQMLNSQTIVYDLNFETPKEEYEYELKRFGGYEELIPIAVEQKQPNEGTITLMNSFVEKGQKMRDIAIETAKSGDFPRAVAMMQDATKEIRRALRMVGVMQ